MVVPFPIPDHFGTDFMKIGPILQELQLNIKLCVFRIPNSSFEKIRLKDALMIAHTPFHL